MADDQGREQFDDEELARQALEANPDPPIAIDAKPWSPRSTSLAPGWYMGPSNGVVRRGVWRWLALAFVVVFVFVVFIEPALSGGAGFLP